MITLAKRYLHFCVYCSIIHNAQDVETTRVSGNGLMTKKKRSWVRMCDGLLFRSEEGGNPAISTVWKKLEGTLLRDKRHRKTNTVGSQMHVESKNS